MCFFLVCLFCLHYVFNRLNPTYDQALNNLGNLIKVRFESYFMIPVVCWNGFFQTVSRTVDFSRGFKKKKWSRDDISWPKFAVQLLQIPQMYQARGQSCPCDGFCICRTFLCNTSCIVYYFHCLLGLAWASVCYPLAAIFKSKICQYVRLFVCDNTVASFSTTVWLDEIYRELFL